MDDKKYSPKDLEIRLINKKDYYWLLYLKNQKHIREAESKKRPYYTEDLFDNFIKKMEKAHEAKKDYFYIIEMKNAPLINNQFSVEEIRVGYIRIQQKEDEKWYLGVGVDRSCLGKNVATIAIEKLSEEHMGIQEFLTNIDQENSKSIGLFKKSGFKKIGEKENHLVYLKENTAVY